MAGGNISVNVGYVGVHGCYVAEWSISLRPLRVRIHLISLSQQLMVKKYV